MADAKRIDGKAFAEGLRERVGAEVARIKSESDVTPGLAVVLVGEDPASSVYVRNKAKQTEEAGMKSIEHRMPMETNEADLLALIGELNGDASINGILVQLPLPDQIDEQKVLAAIDVEKDVDGFHVENVGRLWTGGDALVPCTPFGCILMLKEELGDLSGQRAVIVGRSNIVGKPMALLLMQKGPAANATVTVCHSRTQNLADITRTADILIAAIGSAKFVTADMVKPGAVVIDVGTNRVDEKLVGDVDFGPVSGIASAITPVPGGVGPMTIAMLLRNTLTAARLSVH